MRHFSRPGALTLAVTAAFANSSMAVADPVADAGQVVILASKPALLPGNTGTLSGEDIAARRAYVSDTASLLGNTPGMSFYNSGGVSSLPVIHGLNDDRIRIQLDGMDVTSACGNHMNPPLSYIDLANVGHAQVIAGITPVSAGGDSIGGTIVIDSKPPVFAKAGEGRLVGGSLSTYFRSNGNASGGSVTVSAAGENVSASYTGATARSGNYESGSGFEVRSSKYETQNHALTFAARTHRQQC